MSRAMPSQCRGKGGALQTTAGCSQLPPSHPRMPRQRRQPPIRQPTHLQWTASTCGMSTQRCQFHRRHAPSVDSWKKRCRPRLLPRHRSQLQPPPPLLPRQHRVLHGTPTDPLLVSPRLLVVLMPG